MINESKIDELLSNLEKTLEEDQKKRAAFINSSIFTDILKSAKIVSESKREKNLSDFHNDKDLNMFRDVLYGYEKSVILSLSDFDRESSYNYYMIDDLIFIPQSYGCIHVVEADSKDYANYKAMFDAPLSIENIINKIDTLENLDILSDIEKMYLNQELDLIKQNKKYHNEKGLMFIIDYDYDYNDDETKDTRSTFEVLKKLKMFEERLF